MKPLVCDVCGGKLVMQAGGIAKCDYCGLEYSVESLKEKVMQITGTVNVQGIATADNLMIRANDCVNEGDLEKAMEYYRKCLDLNPLDERIKAKIAEIHEKKAKLKQPGALLKAKVTDVMEFGVFVEFYVGERGMVHVSKLCERKISHPSEAVARGDELWVVCLEPDRLGRFAYSAVDGEALEKNKQRNL